jgi:DNA-binding NtrC family response regulator
VTEQFKVLVVDDDETLLQLLTETVQTMGCSATSARNGIDALNMISERKFDIVVTDLKMPGMDGLELLAEIKKVDKEVVVIMVTGYATLETAVKAIEKGAYDYIAKPFRLDELMVVIKNACERLRLLKQKSALLDELKGAYNEIDRLKQVATASSDVSAADEQEVSLETIDFESFKRRSYQQPIDIESARKKYFSDV